MKSGMFSKLSLSIPNHSSNTFAGAAAKDYHRQSFYRSAKASFDLKDQPKIKRSSPITRASKHSFGDMQSAARRIKHCYDEQQIGEASALLSHVTLDVLPAILPQLPLDFFIEKLPATLPLLEALYSKFYAASLQPSAGGNSAVALPSIEALLPYQFLLQIAKLFAQQQEPVNGMASAVICCDTLQLQQQEINWLPLMPCLKNILKIIVTLAPQLMRLIEERKAELDQALNGLGDHGLINCGDTKLIDIGEAIRLELAQYFLQVKQSKTKYSEMLAELNSGYQRSKARNSFMGSHGNLLAAGSIFDISGTKSVPPSETSHQRLMNLRLSDIKLRLQKNDFSLQLVDDLMTNSPLLALTRILRKRITYDKQVLCEFSFLTKRMNSLGTMPTDPMLSKLFLQYSKAFERLLRLMATGSSADSGCEEDIENLETSTMSNETSPVPASDNSATTAIASSLDIKSASAADLLNSSRNNLSSDSNSAQRSSQDHYDRICPPSVWKLPPLGYRTTSQISLPAAVLPENTKPSLRSAVSQTQLANRKQKHCPLSRGLKAKSIHLSEESDLDTKTNRRMDGIDQERTEIRRLRTEVEALKLELDVAKLSSRQPGSSSRSSSLSVNAVFYTSHIEQIELVESYSNLYAHDRRETMDELAKLTELRGSEELQTKILLSVVVLSFRSVQTTMDRERRRFWDAFGEKNDMRKLNDANSSSSGSANGNAVEPVVHNLDATFRAYVKQKASKSNFAENTKEVTAQIWSTLYDFPSLQACRRFSHFISDCVATAWELSAATPNYFIEYQSSEFSHDLHTRVQGSKKNAPRIRKYVWPGLMQAKTQKCLFRGIVLT